MRAYAIVDIEGGVTMSTLGEVIRTYREEHGLSLREFAYRCTLSHSYVDKLEKECDPRTGKSVDPTVDTLRLIASGMGITLETLMARAGYLPENAEDILFLIRSDELLRDSIDPSELADLKSDLNTRTKPELAALLFEWLYFATVHIPGSSDDVAELEAEARQKQKDNPLIAAWVRRFDRIQLSRAQQEYPLNQLNRSEDSPLHSQTDPRLQLIARGWERMSERDRRTLWALAKELIKEMDAEEQNAVVEDTTHE